MTAYVYNFQIGALRRWRRATVKQVSPEQLSDLVLVAMAALPMSAVFFINGMKYQL